MEQERGFRPTVELLLAPELVAAAQANQVKISVVCKRLQATPCLADGLHRRRPAAATCCDATSQNMLPPPAAQVLTPSQLHVLRQQIEALRRINVQLRALKYRARTGAEPAPPRVPSGGGRGRGRGRKGDGGMIVLSSGGRGRGRGRGRGKRGRWVGRHGVGLKWVSLLPPWLLHHAGPVRHVL